MKEIKIVCKNVSEKLATIAFLYGIGIKCSSHSTFQDLLEAGDFRFNDYPNPLVRMRDSNKTFYIDGCGNQYKSDESISFSELHTIPNWIVEASNPTYGSMVISQDYSAIVSKKGIEVGCQNISFEDFDKLAELVAKYR